MTVNDAITKLRVMLSGETEEVIETPTAMAAATLVDGTEVYTEGELAVGATLYVKVEEGEAPFAPAGMHETTEGMMITVGENGEITSIEEATEEAPAEEAPATEEAMEEEVVEEEAEEEKEEETEMSAEDLLAAIAELIKSYKDEVKEEMNSLTERFNAIADEPATKPVRNNFTKEAADAKTKADARLEQLIAIRRGK
jgi:glutamine phosphoribosylpyrophosphate amidotransferase